MKRFSPSLIFVVAMLVLLALLGALQYVQLGKISDTERDRLKARLQADTKRFAEDFNREIQSAYFNFKLTKEYWDGQDWMEFNERYEFWLGRTQFPRLIRGFTYFEPVGSRTLVYDFSQKTFVSATLPEKVKKAVSLIALTGETPPVADEVPALLMPLHSEKASPFGNIVIRPGEPLPSPSLHSISAKPEAFLIIELDREVLTGEMLAEINQRYFSDADGINYSIAVVDRNGGHLYSTNPVATPDSTAKILDLAPTDFVFYSNRELMDKTSGGVTRSVVLRSTTQSTVQDVRTTGNSNIGVQILTEDIKPRIEVKATAPMPEPKGAWTLNVQHRAGSVDGFVTNQLRKDLAVNFGILFLLGGSVVFVYLSAQRARRFAQRQVDFVSSVSHEFRTPLAVIYSASENLADGVTREPEQIAKYGELIKGEGRKLSGMIEQILEFAGARAGKRRYDFDSLSLNSLLDEAVEECGPLISSKGFEVERDDRGSLEINGDRTALLGAFQNLITNAVKYSNGHKYLRIASRLEDNLAVVDFIDRGIGIAPTEQKKIFEPFYRSKTVVDEQIHGNGLGLSLVLETIRAHGGSIEVESEPGKGSRFTIRLPRRGTVSG